MQCMQTTGKCQYVLMHALYDDDDDDDDDDDVDDYVMFVELTPREHTVGGGGGKAGANTPSLNVAKIW